MQTAALGFEGATSLEAELDERTLELGDRAENLPDQLTSRIVGVIGEIVGFGSRAGDEVSTTLADVTQQDLLGQEIASETVETGHDDHVPRANLGEQFGEGRAIFDSARDSAILEEADRPDVPLPEKGADRLLLLLQAKSILGLPSGADAKIGEVCHRHTQYDEITHL